MSTASASASGCLKGVQSAYACSSGLSPESVMAAAKKAARMIAADGKGSYSHLVQSTCRNVNPAARIGSSIPLADKVALVRRAYRAAREYSSEVSQANIRLLDYDRNILIATSDGLMVTEPPGPQPDCHQCNRQRPAASTRSANNAPRCLQGL